VRLAARVTGASAPSEILASKTPSAEGQDSGIGNPGLKKTATLADLHS
jgi:hypothetical protein